MHELIYFFVYFGTALLKPINMLLYLVMLNVAFSYAIILDIKKSNLSISVKKYLVIHGGIIMIILINYLFLNSYFYIDEKYILGITALEVLDIMYRKRKKKKSV